MLKDFFALRGTLPKRTQFLVFLFGTLFMILLWEAITGVLRLVPQGILPSPLKVLISFKVMHFEDALVRNAIYSTKLNLIGLFEAAALAIPLGMIIGLFPGVRAFFQRHIEAIRYLPMTALTGLFIAWFGIEDNMKIQFLALSIFFYLLPQVILKVDEVNEVYVQTMYTLGATKWQTIRHVFIPYVVSMSFHDVRVMAAVSWTYIVVAEMVNANGGGIGAMAYLAGRYGKTPHVFGIVFTIILIGVVIDELLIFIDKKIFQYKYAGGKKT